MEYTRQNIKSDMLKRVILTCNFKGGTDIESMVNYMKQQDFMKKGFGLLLPLSQRQYNVEINPEKIRENNVPINERQNVIYHFTKCKIDRDVESTFDIYNDTLTLAIDASKSYYGSKLFTDFFASAIDAIHHYDQFISFDRIGIRKIDIKELAKKEEIPTVFNDKYLVSKVWLNDRENIIAKLQNVFKDEYAVYNMITQITKTSKNKIQAVIDTDSYLNRDSIYVLIKKGMDVLKDFMMRPMQDKMFEFFVSNVTETYLNHCLIK